MESLISKLWLIIIAWGAWEAYQVYEQHTEKIENINSVKPRIHKKIREAKKEKKQIKTYLRDIEEAKKNIELVAQEVERLQKKLPESIQDVENLRIIRNIASGLNITKIYLSPATEENKGFYFTKRYEFTGTGTYLQFIVFFEKIASSERLLNIKEVNFKRSAEPQRGRFQLTNAKVIIESYRYNPEHKEDRGISGIEKTFKESKKKKGKKKKGRGKKKRRRSKK